PNIELRSGNDIDRGVVWTPDEEEVRNQNAAQRLYIVRIQILVFEPGRYDDFEARFFEHLLDLLRGCGHLAIPVVCKSRQIKRTRRPDGQVLRQANTEK